MTDNTIIEIATKVVNNQILYNWQYYLFLFVLLIVSNAITSYAISYFKKRGESKALHDDFEAIHKELKLNAEAIETIKSKVSHDEWEKKEHIVLRRSKLEELMICVYELSGWLDKETDEKVFGKEKNKDTNPIYKIKMIAGLYFPELNDDIRNIYVSSLEYQKWIINKWKERIEGRLDIDGPGAYGELYKNLISCIESLEKRIIELMGKVIKK